MAKNSGRKAQSVEDVILGEAISVNRGNVVGAYEDMLAIASVIANRAEQLGVRPEDVLTQRQFNAYGKALPAGSERNAWMARQAWNEVMTKGPVHNATFYATPAATKNLPSGLTQVGATRGHQYFVDPQNRSIETKLGSRVPGSVAMASLPERVPVPTPAPRGGISGNQMTLASFIPDRSPAASRGVQAINAAMNLPEEAAIESDLRPDNYMPEVTDMNPLFSAGKGASRRSIEKNANANIGNTVYSHQRAMALYEAATGRRAPAINDAIAKSGTSRERDTKGSQHFRGNALDISIKGMSDREKQALVSSLQAAGFTSFGFGVDFLHADRRPANEGRRTWTYQGIKSFAGIPIDQWHASVRAGQLPQQVIDNVNAMGNPRVPVPLPAPTRVPAAPPVPTPAPSRVPQSAVQFASGPSSRTPPVAPQSLRSVPESAVQFGPGPASRTTPGNVPQSAVEFATGPRSRNQTPIIDPRQINRMQDNLRNQLAFRAPNPSNMNVSGYGFSTPAKGPLGPSLSAIMGTPPGRLSPEYSKPFTITPNKVQTFTFSPARATGSATGSVAESPRAVLSGSVAVPARQDPAMNQSSINTAFDVARTPVTAPNAYGAPKAIGQGAMTNAGTDNRGTIGPGNQAMINLERSLMRQDPVVSMDSVARQAQNATRQSMQRETWKDVATKPQERLQEAAKPMAPVGTPANMGAAGYGLSRPSPIAADPRAAAAMAGYVEGWGAKPGSIQTGAKMPMDAVMAPRQLQAPTLPPAVPPAQLATPQAAPAPQRQAPAVVAPAQPRQVAPQISNEPQYSGRTPGDRARSAAFQPGGIFGYTSQQARGGGGYNPTPV